jgi:peptidoglycan-associated lipoprotein
VNTPPLPARNEPIRAQPTRTATLAEQFETAMQNILFEYDQALIRTTEIPKLQSATQFLIANPSVQLIVEGNADERGSQEYNIALGDERAAVVKKYFVDHGVTSSRLDALSYGEERPLCRQETEGCWQRNRRAQFTMKP